MPETFESLLVKLTRAGVDYLVVGGVAVCLNGFVRTTQDIDLLIDASAENLERLLGCLGHFGEGFARELNLSDFSLEEGAVRVVEDFTIDLFTMMRGRTFGDLAGTARQLTVDDTPIRFLSPQALIDLKAPSTREKDQLDVATLRRIIAGETPAGIADLDGLTPKD